MLNTLWRKLTGGAPVVPAEPNAVYAPMTGTIVPLEQIPDPVFSERMLGDGLAILPSSGEVVAPFDGEVASLFPTGHAIGLASDSGVECLIHIGLDTVELNGAGFTVNVKQGDRVSKGQRLIHVDLALLTSAGKKTMTPVVITNSALWRPERFCESGEIDAGGDILFHVAKND
jgi:PTS system glucose-specific IIA component